MIIHFILLSVVYMTAGDFPLICPSKSQWRFRAQSFCNNPDDYRCLWDGNAHEFVEQCDGFDIQMKGFRKIILGDITAGECTTNTYQPRMWTTKGNSDCVFQKSLCTEIGQVVYDDGSSITDRRCGCDYNAGFVFLQKPKASCYCVPSEEDCTCIKKTCPYRHIVDPEYECRSLDNWKLSFNCHEISHSDPTPVPTLDLTKEPIQGNDIQSRDLTVIMAVIVCTIIIVIIKAITFGMYLLFKAEEASITKYIYINITQDDISQKMKVDTINKWQEQLRLFVPTRASSAVTASLESNQCVIITGPPGCGKTFTAYSVVMEMVEREGYDLLIIKDPIDIIRYSRTNIKQLVFIDDIIGKCKVNEYNTRWWNHHEKQVRDILSKNRNIRILATCRSYIYNLYRENICIFFHHLNFLSEDICLTIDERRQIGRQYIGDNIELIGDETISMYNFFPELCKRFKPEPEALSEFHSPCCYITTELNIIMNDSVEEFILLSLMVVSNNHMTEKSAEDFLERNTVVVDRLFKEIKVHTVHVVSIKLLNALCGTYFMNTDDIYCFITRRLFDVVTYCIWDFIKTTVLRYGTMDFIEDKCILERLNRRDLALFVIVPEELESLYFDRILTQIRSQFRYELSRKKHRCDRYRQKLLEELKRDTRFTYKGLIDMKTASSILHIVSKLGYVDYVDFFAELEPERINSQDNMNRTPLHFAVLNGHELVVKSLIRRGVLIDINDKEGNTPLNLACAKGHNSIVSLLLSNKTTLEHIPHILAKPLFTVCKNGNSTLVNMLIKSKAEVNVRDEHQLTPLFWAVKYGFEEITELLLEHRAYIDVVDTQNQTPLHHACKAKHDEMVRILIENEAKISIQNTQNELPLHIACSNGCYFITVLLTIVKCNINYQDENGNTPLYNACVNGYLDIVVLLLEKGANANIFNNSLDTPLHAASKYGFLEIAQVLLEHDADITLHNILNKTPLHLACYKGSYDLVCLLLAQCDTVTKIKKRVRIAKYINQKDNAGNTALHLACYKGNFSCYIPYKERCRCWYCKQRHMQAC